MAFPSWRCGTPESTEEEWPQKSSKSAKKNNEVTRRQGATYAFYALSAFFAPFAPFCGHYH